MEAMLRITPPAVRFHVFHSGEHAVIEAFHVHFEHAVEVSLGCRFEFANVGDAGIVHQRVNAATLGQRLETRFVLLADL